MILDIDEPNWKAVFTNEELLELQATGKPLVRPAPEEVSTAIKDIQGMVSISFDKLFCIRALDTNL